MTTRLYIEDLKKNHYQKTAQMINLKTITTTQLSKCSYNFSSVRFDNWGISSKNRKLYQSYLVSDSKNKDNDDAKSLMQKAKIDK
ncbi:14913_t:CDS:2 [Funneliformis caledonium]|uniref:14913_t:CDS:1 n=1 Tax=Funneliformis caledonium TaxID=1117310 RepID=A0A9N9GHJ4_9GLOM|nr:14913_t:CDS:2 [Funneliformis caledonium]